MRKTAKDIMLSRIRKALASAPEHQAFCTPIITLVAGLAKTLLTYTLPNCWTKNSFFGQFNLLFKLSSQC